MGGVRELYDTKKQFLTFGLTVFLATNLLAQGPLIDAIAVFQEHIEGKYTAFLTSSTLKNQDCPDTVEIFAPHRDLKIKKSLNVNALLNQFERTKPLGFLASLCCSSCCARGYRYDIKNLKITVRKLYFKSETALSFSNIKLSLSIYELAYWYYANFTQKAIYNSTLRLKHTVLSESGEKNPIFLPPLRLAALPGSKSKERRFFERTVISSSLPLLREIKA